MRLHTLQAIKEIPMVIFSAKDIFNFMPYVAKKHSSMRNYNVGQIANCLAYYTRMGVIHNHGRQYGIGRNDKAQLYSRKNQKDYIFTRSADDFLNDYLIGEL